MYKLFFINKNSFSAFFCIIYITVSLINLLLSFSLRKSLFLINLLLHESDFERKRQNSPKLSIVWFVRVIKSCHCKVITILDKSNYILLNVFNVEFAFWRRASLLRAIKPRILSFLSQFTLRGKSALYM